METQDITRLVSDGFDKAKAGEALAVYAETLPFFEQGSLPWKSHYAFGWIIYYALHQMPDGEIESRKRMLANYLRLRVPVPHKLHSMILTEAIRLYKDARTAAFGKKDAPAFSILRFLPLWHSENLRPGDWNRKEHDGRQLPSTVEKLMTACVDELEEMHLVPSEEIQSIIARLKNLYPGSDTIHAQTAALHALAGNHQEAREMYRSAILLAPSKFHLWKKLAMLIDAETNPHLHLALLYKALTAPGQEQFKGKVRIQLAKVMASRGAFPQALWELEKVRNLYEANGWHLSQSFLSVDRLIPEATIPSDPTSLYRKVEYLADDEIYSALPAIEATKTYHKDAKENPGGKYPTTPIAWRVTDAKGQNYWIQPHRHKIRPDLPLGTRLSIRVFNGKAVKAELI